MTDDKQREIAIKLSKMLRRVQELRINLKENGLFEINEECFNQIRDLLSSKISALNSKNIYLKSEELFNTTKIESLLTELESINCKITSLPVKNGYQDKIVYDIKD